MHSYRTSAEFSDLERLVLRLADAVTDTPAEVPQELFDDLRVRLPDEQIVELASSLAWENYRARFNRVFDVGAEGYSDGAYCPLPVARTVSDPTRLDQGADRSDR